MYISLEPVLRQGWRYKKMVLIKNVFQDMLSIFYILSKNIFLGGRDKISAIFCNSQLAVTVKVLYSP